MSTPLQHPKRVIPVEDVCAITGLAISTIYMKMAKDQFPKGFKYGTGRGSARRWRESEILDWIDSHAVADHPEQEAV